VKAIVITSEEMIVLEDVEYVFFDPYNFRVNYSVEFSDMMALVNPNIKYIVVLKEKKDE